MSGLTFRDMFYKCPHCSRWIEKEKERATQHSNDCIVIGKEEVQESE